MERPQFKQLRRAYGFDEVAIVPGDVTINPDQTDIHLTIGPHTFEIPIFAAALDHYNPTLGPALIETGQWVDEVIAAAKAFEEDAEMFGESDF